MIELTNYVSKIIHNDNNNSYSILTYLDIDDSLTEEYIINYINEIIKNNPILTQAIIENCNALFLNKVIIPNISEYYKIEYTKTENFDDYISDMLNKDFNAELKWMCLWCIDKDNKNTRFYFKIHHAYVDGYQLIKILTSPFQNNDITKQFKRTTDTYGTIYYYLIGTVVLILINIKFCINILLNNLYLWFNKTEEPSKNKEDTDYILCKNIDFNEIKTFTKKYKITVNDFLYSLMIKTDKLYRKEEKILSTTSPINISGTTQSNNSCPIFNIINNSYDNYTLLNKVHSVFNNFKYSLFIPLLSAIINIAMQYIPLDIMSICYSDVLNNTDYIFSNIIGPSIKDVKFKITDIHFLTTSKTKEIIYNIISCENNINIICSFKKNVIEDKERFEKCIYEAYDSLITTVY